jgi:hypothetical protein
MNYCPQCGAQLVPGAQFCTQCGAQLGGQLASGVGPLTLPPDVVPVQPRLRTSIPSFIRERLWPGEQVLGAFSASVFDHHRRHDFRHDKFLLTDRRIIAYRTALIHKSMNELPYSAITGVYFTKGFIHGKVIVDAANFGMTLDRIGNDDAAFAESIISGAQAGVRYQVQ